MNERCFPKPCSSSPRLGLCGSILSQPNSLQSAWSSKALSSIMVSGFCSGRPGLPVTAGMLTTNDKSVFTSWRFAAVHGTTSGTPTASVNRLCLPPERPRSVRFGPVLVRPAGLSPNCNRRALTTSQGDRHPAVRPGTTHEFVARGPTWSTRRCAACRSCTRLRMLRSESLSNRSRSSTRTILTEEQSQLRPTSPLAKAVQYTLNRRVELTRFLDDGRIELDTGLLERSLRGPALRRKNYLFFSAPWQVVARRPRCTASSKVQSSIIST
jgi:hypothetical protein